VEFPQSGGCACGNIRYQLVSNPLTIYACHCTDCQTMTGSSFFLSMFVHKDEIKFQDEKPQLFEFLLTDGRERSTFGCENCRTWLCAEPNGLDELLLLWTGTLDDSSWVHPVGHIFTRSAQPWITIPNCSLRYEAAPDSLDPFYKAWSSRSSNP
jgi:hypothetical protein